ncbi:hypothetical protein LMJF_06_0630 [Leishmania major strain Friedlin]|uniref:Uncharacterized protein n=1 Tax=Leishmania major TaxID=5664 RepID=Q4QJ15_LEIMA|nr:hypothetical protein LMJF_06_0630 [Leishmania major strain Friedlin]CAG9568858.1 hypothetical_protein_-_conserved [Leishmania major strain Friedlin]CAJ02108.1 hypothetical protein LMJF_06_0630 [Leishmania major strain Friedlin]|eukprot:XP_001680833.1 hypothetical protein LMJF_06_0630 [Leishmania major strain Friedlin]
MEEVVCGGSEAQGDRGRGRYEDARQMDGYMPTFDGSWTRLHSSSSSWWLSHSRSSTGCNAAPPSATRRGVSGTPGATASAASAAVNPEVAPQNEVTLNLARNAQTRWREHRLSYPTLREIVHQLAQACKEEQWMKHACLSAMRAAAAARYGGRTSDNGISSYRCCGGDGDAHDVANRTHNDASPKAAPAAATCAALPTLRTSLDWVRHLLYVPMYPIEEAIEHLEHKQDDDILLALFYSPDLFSAYNYVQWIGLMVTTTCSLLRAGVLDPITHIRGDDDVDGVFPSRFPPSNSTGAMRNSGNRRQPPLFCRDLALPSLEGMLSPGDTTHMRDNKVRVAIIDGYYPLWNVTRTVRRHMGRDTFHVHERYWGFGSNDGDDSDHYAEAEATEAAETVEAPTASGVGSLGVPLDVEGHEELQAHASAAAFTGSSASTYSSTSDSTSTAPDPAGDWGLTSAQYRSALLHLLAREGGRSDDICDALRSMSSPAQRGDATSMAETAEDEIHDARAQCDQGCGDSRRDWREQQRNTHRPHAREDATVQTATVAEAKAGSSEVKEHTEAARKTSITAATADTSSTAAPFLSLHPFMRAEEARFCPSEGIHLLARHIIDESETFLLNRPSVLLDALQNSLHRVRHRRQLLVERIVSWSQRMTCRLHVNVSAQRIDALFSDHLGDARYQAMPHASGVTASAAGGGDTEEELEDEEAMGDDVVIDAGLVQSGLSARTSYFYHQRLCSSHMSAALDSASALQCGKKKRRYRRNGPSAPMSLLTEATATLSTPKLQPQQHTAPASPPPSVLSFTHDSADESCESLDVRVADASVAATLTTLATATAMASGAQGDGGDSSGADNVSDDAEGEDEVLEDEASGLDDDADDEYGAHELSAQDIDGMRELESEEKVFVVRRADEGAAGRPTAEALSMYPDNGASVQGAGSACGGGDASGSATGTQGLSGTSTARSSATCGWCLLGTAAHRHYLLRQSPPVLLFPRKQGSRPYLFPQTLLRLAHLRFPKLRGPPPPHEHARPMRSRWGCMPVASSSTTEGVAGEPSMPCGGAAANGGGGGDSEDVRRGPNGAWAVAEGEGQPQGSSTRSGPRPHNGGDGSSVGAGAASSSASEAASPTLLPTPATYRVISVLDNPFSRIGVEHLHYDFLLSGPSSPMSTVQLLVEESRQASAPGELEACTHCESVYRLQRRQWMEARAKAAEVTAAASSDGKVDSDDGAGGAGSADTDSATEAVSRQLSSEMTEFFSHRRPTHATGASGDHGEPRNTTDSHRLHDRLHRSRQHRLNSSVWTRAEAAETFFNHDASFRPDPDRFTESAPLTLEFFLRTPMHIIEEAIIAPLRQQVKTLHQRLLDAIVEEALRYGRCEISGQRYMQLLADGSNAVCANGTRQPALAKRVTTPVAECSVEGALDAVTERSTSGGVLDDDETPAIPYGCTDDGKLLLHSLRHSAALSVWRLTADLQQQLLQALRASRARTSASASHPPSNDDEMREPIPLPRDLTSVVELLHQPHDVLHSSPPQFRSSSSSSCFSELSVLRTTDAADPATAPTSGAGSTNAGEEDGDGDDDAGTPFFLAHLFGWEHDAMGLDMSHGGSAARHQTFLQRRQLQERLSMLQVAVRALLKRSSPWSMDSFFQLISVEPGAALLVETSPRPPEPAATTTPGDGSEPSPSPSKPPDCLGQYNASYLAVAYLFFNGTAEAYFRTHSLNQRRMHLLHRLDEAVRLSLRARLILLTATEEDYRARHVETAIQDAARRHCIFRRTRSSHEEKQSFPS